jgi:hypothetical protein
MVMPGLPEDERSAANIYASLSSYVMTASLGVIAAQAALATFVLDKRDHLTWFYTCMVLGLTASVVSIALGGKGVDGIASAGFKGSWTLKPKHDYFNLQAVFCLLGMVLLLFSLFSGTTKPESPGPAEIKRLNESVVKLQADLDNLRTQYAKLADEMKSPNCAPQGRPARPKEKHK